MKYNCTIEIENVKSKKKFMEILQIMLNDYEDNNEDYDYHNIIISMGDKVA